MQTQSHRILWPSLAIAASLLAGQAHAQASGSTNTSREMQRGVPGTDVDVNMNANGRARNNGVPGVDVDVRSNAGRNNPTGSDTRAAGASGATMDRGDAATQQRAARADRN